MTVPAISTPSFRLGRRQTGIWGTRNDLGAALHLLNLHSWADMICPDTMRHPNAPPAFAGWTEWGLDLIWGKKLVQTALNNAGETRAAHASGCRPSGGHPSRVCQGRFWGLDPGCMRRVNVASGLSLGFRTAGHFKHRFGGDQWTQCHLLKCPLFACFVDPISGFFRPH